MERLLLPAGIMVALVQYFTSGCKCGARSCKSEMEVEKTWMQLAWKIWTCCDCCVIYLCTPVDLMETEALAR